MIPSQEEPSSLMMSLGLLIKNSDIQQSKEPASNAKAIEKPPSTMKGAMCRFFLGRDCGPISALITLLGFIQWRIPIGLLSTMDAILFSSSIIFWWLQEYFLHQKVLHCDSAWCKGFRKDHHEHHNNPYFHVIIDPAPQMIAWLIISQMMIFSTLLPIRLALSATTGYILAGLLYEWMNYFVHTHVHAPNGWLRKILANHMRHHLLDNRYWFSFSLLAIDDAFGTNPDAGEFKKHQKY